MDDNGFARPGFTAHDGESGVEPYLQVIDDGKIFYGKITKHGEGSGNPGRRCWGWIF
jgi:hypothetical protein